MPNHHDARLDVLLDALCAFADALPPESRLAAGTALTRRAAGRAIDAGADAAVAADLARLLGSLGRLPVLSGGAV